MSKVKALVLFSGGLDSMLAAKTLMEQKIEVTALVFVTPFFGAEKARLAAAELGVELIETDFSHEHLKMVKNPKYGYGKNINPCIDCHAMMLREANKILIKDKYDFIATGEVLGQRPMSQNKEALDIVAKYSGAQNVILRPLSARVLTETDIEKSGKVNRGKLHGISGRTRRQQEALIQEYKIKQSIQAGGGCLLTDPEFSSRLIKMFDYWPHCDVNDVELLKAGRIFWISHFDEKLLVVTGRKELDNLKLEKLAKKGDFMLKLKDIMGPTTLIRSKKGSIKIEKNIIEIYIPEEIEKGSLDIYENKNIAQIIETTSLLTGYYSTKARGKKAIIEFNKIK